MGEREVAVEILGELVAARSENFGQGCGEGGGGVEGRAAAVVAKWFDKFGIPYKIHEKCPGRTNVIGSVGGGRPVLLIPAHLDTVPAGAGWKADPFRLRVEGGRAIGRGACDNKGAMAGAILAAARLVKSRARLGGTLLVAGIADEERGNVYGAKYLLETIGLKADFAIVPDAPSHLEQVDVGEKGAVGIRATALGRAAHGSLPEKGLNAIAAMAELVRILSDTPVPSPPHPHFSPATMNVGTIRGGEVVNMVPDRCMIEVDFRTLPGQDDGGVRRFVEDAAARAKSKYPWAEFEIEIAASMPAHEVEAGSPLVAAVQEAARNALGRELAPLYQGGITLAKEFIRAGIPSVAVGIGAPDAPHIAEEWVEIDEILAFTAFVEESAKVLLRRK